MSSGKEGFKKVEFIHVESEDGEKVYASVAETEKVIIVVQPPFMTAELFAQITGKTKVAVKKDLQRGDIARFQPNARGNVYVNLTKQNQACLDAPDY